MDPSKPANPKPPDIASASVPDTLAALHVNPDTGLTQAEVDDKAARMGGGWALLGWVRCEILSATV